MNAFGISTLGQIQGFLIPITAVMGALIFLGVLVLLAFFLLGLYRESKTIFCAFLVVLLINSFFIFFKAPLDVDGLFYHLTIILNALQKNQWNADDLLLWQIQSTPKMGVTPSLSLAAFFGEYAYRFIGFGHFTSGLVGAFAWVKCAELFRLPKPYVFGFIFITIPLVIKQMGAQYVDLALYAYWFMALALCLEIRMGSLSSRQKLFHWMAVGICFYFVCSIKLNGIALLFSFLPFIWLPLRKKDFKELKYSLIPILFAGMSCLQWMIPNTLRFGNPIFPLEPRGLIPGSGFKFIPVENPVSNVMHGYISTLDFQFPFGTILKWFCTFFIFEPVAQYDTIGGAWGFIGLFFFLLFWVHLKKILELVKRDLNLRLVFLAFIISLLANPVWTVPRYSLSAGCFFLWFGGFYFLKTYSLRKVSLVIFVLLVFIQIPYLSVDRVLLRGMNSLYSFQENKAIFLENLSDVIAFGEPQAQGRFLHYPYVPELRKMEPRTVSVGEDCVDLSALYFGRHFKNHVTFTPQCCRWPFPCDELK